MSDGPFITEDDVFDVLVRYYRDGKKIFVETIDENFEVNRKDIAEIKFVIKYPNQGDCDLMFGTSKKIDLNTDNMNIKTFMELEVVRFLSLVRKWSLKEELNNKNALSLSPKIIKAVISKIREEIQLEGLL